MPAFKDLTGQRFGRLTVIERAENGRSCGKAVTRWLCRCDCGNEIVTEGHSLKRGKTKSCGCLNDETRKRTATLRATTHGGTHTRLYNIYNDMKARCFRKSSTKYPAYGGRGITICDEWVNDFAVFRAWAMANGYRDDLTIDRIDPNGNYCPENCRWATQKEQQNNKRVTRRITIGGVTRTVTEWAEISGIKAATLSTRLYSGCPAERLLDPVEKNRKRRW